MLTLANPLGLLALLGIPAVLAIHFLQRRSIALPVSTWFLPGPWNRRGDEDFSTADERRYTQMKEGMIEWHTKKSFLSAFICVHLRFNHS